MENKIVVLVGRGKGREAQKGYRIKRYKLVYKINNLQ